MELASEHEQGVVGTDAEAPPATRNPATGGLTSAQRWDRKADTAIVVILAVASLLAAWSGYQAGIWSGKKTELVTTAEARQIDATRSTTIGYQVMQIDIAMFMNWLEAYKLGNASLAAFYEDRFHTQFQPAFQAWLATDPLESPSAPKLPFDLTEYQIPQLLEAAALDEAAHLAFAEAEAAGATGDAYVLATMLLAVVLFFAGVCTKIGWRPAQLALLAFAILLLLYSMQRLGALPDGSTWQITPIGA